MKKYIVLLLAAVVPIMVNAESNQYVDPVAMEATAYHYGEVTKDGSKVREGICAGKEEWLGMTAVVYVDDNGFVGELIGIYEIKDTGCDERIRSGECIDIYIPNESDCWKFGRQDVFVQNIKADG